MFCYTQLPVTIGLAPHAEDRPAKPEPPPDVSRQRTPGVFAAQTAQASTEPEPFVTTRWRCPCCPRTYSSKSLARRHVARCWYNPAAQSCKTCEHYRPDRSEPEVGWVEPESCEAGIDLDTAAEDSRGYRTLPINCQQWTAMQAVAR